MLVGRNSCSPTTLLGLNTVQVAIISWLTVSQIGLWHLTKKVMCWNQYDQMTETCWYVTMDLYACKCSFAQMMIILCMSLLPTTLHPLQLNSHLNIS